MEPTEYSYRLYFSQAAREHRDAVTTTDEAPDLQTRLIYAQVCVGGQPGFIPKGILEALITEDAVLKILNNVPRGHSTDAETPQSNYARLICSTTGNDRCTFRRIFAILMLIDRPEEVVSFVVNGVDDSYLPLEGMPRMPEGPQSVFLCLRSTPGTPIPFLRSWSAGKCRDFYREQWAVVAPCFEKPRDGKVRFYDLHDKDVLPWTWQDEEHRGGGFSKVKHVRIHEQHHDFDE
jgi:hypothetical protein